MITITDTDLPVTVAEKIITGIKPSNISQLEKNLMVAFTGDKKACDTIDMFSLEEIKEIADYLMVYYNNNID